jgi:hypothetical protein
MNYVMALTFCSGIDILEDNLSIGHIEEIFILIAVIADFLRTLYRLIYNYN